MQIASGIFTWGADERRSGRYGYFACYDSDYDDRAFRKPTFGAEAADSMLGKRVKIVAKVVESRPSGHVGDKFLGLFPTQPNVGDEIVLGVGYFVMLPPEDADRSTPQMGIVSDPQNPPEEQRMDPRVFYRLHDQTVTVEVEETDEPVTTFEPVVPIHEDGAISNGDGTIQIRTKRPVGSTIKVAPKVEHIVDGLFCMKPPTSFGNEGERYDIC